MELYVDTFSGDVDSNVFKTSLELSEADITLSAGFLPFNKTSPSLSQFAATFPINADATTNNGTDYLVNTTTTAIPRILSSTISEIFDRNNVDVNYFDKTTVGSYGLFGELEQYTELWVARYLNLYYLWVLFLFGFTGNIATFITVIKIRPHRSYTICIAVLAIINNCAIISKLLFHQLTLYDAPIGPWGCRILYYLVSFFSMYSSWIIVTMTLERFVAIYFPMKVVTVCTRAKMLFFLVILAVFLLLADIHFLWTSTDTFHPIFKQHCGFLRQYQHFIRYYWYWMDGCMYAIIPCILLLIFNTVNIFGIRQSYKTQKELLKNRSELIVERFRDQGKITVMVVAVSVLFLLLVLPNCFHYIIKPTWDYTPLSHEHALFLLTREIIFVLSDCNHGIQFFIYFVMAKPFRREFVKFFFCHDNRGHRSSNACYMLSALNPLRKVKLISVSTLNVINVSNVEY
ncbi:allatostatin-A receptor-like [Gigantopelta aegis]|uniref:allatostatin-A receptor-like n=1 Tax=Gigantopelta aegis TaxID=1735272 RepID=UPI001B88BDCA|nr:allatostatin-A receptor-like [Gigantopelta aegis]